MISVAKYIPYTRECVATGCEEVLTSFKQTKMTDSRFRRTNSNSFSGFCMLPGVAENATDAEREILDKSIPGGPALGKLYKQYDDGETILKQKKKALRILDRAQEFYDTRVLEYHQRLLAKPPKGHTQCVSCKSNISNTHISKCLSHNRCLVCDGKFQNYTNIENYFNPIKKKYEDIPHPYKAVWGGWM